jgi:hypothetical protein
MALALLLAWALLPHPTPKPSAAALSAVEEFRGAAADARARHPSVEANAAARKLEEIAAALGADLAPPLPDRAHPTLTEGDRLKKAGLSAYLVHHVESAEDVVAPPPLPATAYLADHADDVDRLADALLAETAPVWELATPHRDDSPEPSYEGHMNAQRVLLCRALSEIERRRYGSAARYLEASWRLKEATAARPSIMWQMLAIAAARWELGVLRKMPTSDPGWPQRLTFAVQRSRTLDVVGEELLLSDRADRFTEADYAESVAYLKGLERVAQDLNTMDPCSLTRAASQSVWRRALGEAGQSSAGDIVAPNLGNMVRRAYRLQLEGELTAKILQLRSGGGAFEPESAVCPGARWSSYQLPDGSTNVRFAGHYEDWDDGGIRPPLQFTLRPAATGARP